ncbi:septum formation family protein [Microbacterium sp. KSW-18]|uniref:Septum formation family protein n=1 Tax=Microbacterium aquilitoris TaxID=3067307 RepID=A0ABU3GFP4_9MICO|nr:septum formation family protein [Microbacterium sp. KSW-18]MDT3329512.1 septum formation family protein [Microbacterium sp. KSW-18]
MSTRRWRSGALAAAGLVVAAPLMSGCSEAALYQLSGAVYRDASGVITVGGELDVFDLVAGDCFDESDAVHPRATEDSVYVVQAIPCGDAHTYEVYHVFVLHAGDYPGEDGTATAADEGCLPAFEDFVGQPWEDSLLEYSFYTPTESGWDGIDKDRMVQCFIGDEGVSVTGSAADDGRQSS